MSGSAAKVLAAAARGSFAGFAGSVSVTTQSRCWASVTFSGERHRLRVRLEGSGAARAADAFLEELAEREFDTPGHIVADIALVADAREADGSIVRLELEALTVEAG